MNALLTLTHLPSVKRSLLAGAAVLALASSPVAAEVDEIHFLIPGGAGGGWDGTARGTGEALSKAGIVETVSFENMSGGGGGKAIAHLIETADGQPNTLMVNSTPIVIRSLQNVFPQSFRDLTPIAATIGDYASMVVPKGSSIGSLSDLMDAFQADPSSVSIGGGSVAGGMDHLVVALIVREAGADPRQVKYVPYDAGGKAMAGLLSGEIQALSTGFSEAVDMARQDQVDILCVTAPERLPVAPETPTCAESGADGVEFVNWRGFFAAPGLPAEQQQAMISTLEAMYDSAEWAEVRDRNGWVEIWRPGTEFTGFLENQEQQIGDLMRELGFL